MVSDPIVRVPKPLYDAAKKLQKRYREKGLYVNLIRCITELEKEGWWRLK